MLRQSCFKRLRVVALLFSIAASVFGQSIPKDTTIPNQFSFTSVSYFTSQGTTNATILVRFSPGNRSWYGTVNYSTRDDTAVSNKDYTPVSGSLTFSGNNYGSFTVPLSSTSSNGQKTILLFLTQSPLDPNAIISGSNAVLNINLPPPPNVEITPQQNGTVIVSWPDDQTDVFLEKRTPPGTNWVIVPPWSGSDGVLSCIDTPGDGMAIYRLRRPQ